ncbi:hypothetical protein ACFX13_037171 [Malus domestica]
MVGVSIMIGLMVAVYFALFACLKSFGFTVLSIPFLYASLVSLAAHPLIDLPMLLGKNLDGSFPTWSIIMFSPYLCFVRFFSALRRLHSREAPYIEISEGLFVGRSKLSSSYASSASEPRLEVWKLLLCEEDWTEAVGPTYDVAAFNLIDSKEAVDEVLPRY